MRTIHICNQNREDWLWDGQGWTDDGNRARKFATTHEAVSFALQHRVQGAGLLVKFDDGSEPIAFELAELIRQPSRIRISDLSDPVGVGTPGPSAIFEAHPADGGPP